MEIEIKLNRAKVKEIIIEYLTKEGFTLKESDIKFDVSQCCNYYYDYYDQPAGYEFNCIRAKVTRG